MCLCLSFHLIDFNVYIYFLTFARCIIFVLYHIVFWKLTTWNNLIFFPSSTLCTFHSLFYILIAQVPAVIKLISWTIKSILIHEYQHGETRVWRESTQLQHESTQINTNLKQIYITKKKIINMAKQNQNTTCQWCFLEKWVASVNGLSFFFQFTSNLLFINVFNL